MHVHTIIFSFHRSFLLEKLADLLNGYLSALRMNGQVCGREWTSRLEKDKCCVFVNTPEPCALDERFFSEFVRKAVATAATDGVEITSQLVGESIEGAKLCSCTDPSGFALFTTFLSLESPIRCMDCFGVIPLYRFSPLQSGEFYEVICWQSDYQSCDRLQMNCSVLEEPATAQLSELDSSLTSTGRDICTTMSNATGKPFYYYLYRASGSDFFTEQQRRCPSCSGAWSTDRSIHNLFDFKCDHCHLLSNIAWDVKE